MVAFAAVLKVKFSILVKLIKLLCGKADFGNGDGSVGKAIVERLCIAKTDDIAKLIPEVVNVEAVASESLLA